MAAHPLEGVGGEGRPRHSAASQCPARRSNSSGSIVSIRRPALLSPLAPSKVDSILLYR